MTRARIALLWFAFAAFIAYLSFVPFRFQPLPLDDALAAFARTPYLKLGAGSRADWVANILMFIPLGWLAAAFFVPRPRGAKALLAVLPALLIGSAWAVAVEFAQLYFPNRTVSINDIVAEVIGTAVGALLWCAVGARSLDWWQAIVRGGRTTAAAALVAYLLAYLVLSFSPFDLIISGEELARKAASNLHGWWMAPVACGRAPCAVGLLAEAMAVLPFGWWWAARRRDAPGTLLSGVALGLALGVAIEVAQFFLVSGTSQGASVVSRAAGVGLGAWLHASRGRIAAFDWDRWGRRLVLAGVLPYLAAVAVVAGWFGGRWLGVEAGLARVDRIQWMPFYYQYFTTEQTLIRSTLVHLALYAPIGVAAWLWGWRARRVSVAGAVLLAAAIAVVAETGKLFMAGRHPDYTNVLFAMIAAGTAAMLLRRASSARVTGSAPSRVLSGDEPRRHRATGIAVADDALAAAPAADAATARASATSPAARVAAVALLLVVAATLVAFPVWPAAVGLGLGAYALLLFRRPLIYLWCLPVAVPLLDLAPFSGRLFWDEFDLLLAVTLGVRLLAGVPGGRGQLPSRGALELLGASVLASTLVALWPPALPDANSFNNYLSPWNAVRVAKGYFWAGLMLWLIWRDAGAAREVSARLQTGLALGLVAAALGVFWERAQFLGIAEFGARFRAAGMVSATHVGGAYLEAMLVMLTPFALAQAARAQRAAESAAWLGATVLGAAAVLMTLSRAAAAAWLLAVVVFALLWWLRGRDVSAAILPRALGGAAVVALGVGAVLAASVQSGVLRERIEFSGADLGVRLAHWRDSFDLMQGNGLRGLVGMGLGSFPREFYLGSGAIQGLPAYQLGAVAGRGSYLSLAGGKGLYVDQRVAAAGGQEVVLSGQLRSVGAPGTLSAALCVKSFLTSLRCEWRSIAAGADWQPFEARLRVPERAARPLLRPPLALSLHNAAFGTRIDVTQLSLRDGGTERLDNGDFARGLDRWFVFSDAHLAWRTHNSPLQVFFEQGALGVLAWLALGLSFLTATLRSPDLLLRAAAVAAAAGAFVVGLFDSLLDAPRLVLLLGLVFWAAPSAEPYPSRGLVGARGRGVHGVNVDRAAAAR